VACPYFVPLEIVGDGPWPHPSRLPLGAGWKGNCLGSGSELPASEDHLRDFCNLGYATSCPHLPQHRDWDAVRFSVAHASGHQLTLGFVCELGHAPMAHGKLICDFIRGAWFVSHSSSLGPQADPRVLRLAVSYLQTYRARDNNSQ
jgi:hypothetical protein